MSAATRIGAYALILAAVFAAAFLGGRLLVPDDAPSAWTEQTQEGSPAGGSAGGSAQEHVPRQMPQDEDHGTAEH